MESGQSSAVRFGVFEVDLETRELRKRGVRIKLQDQPFRVLEALLEKPGQIVTREQLRDRLWADDEFVEFDKSLNTAVQKIRQALSDSADTPRFVETIPRRGYRFVAPVETQAATESLGTSSEQQASRRRTLWPALAAVAVVAALAGWRINEPTEPKFDPNAYQLRRLTSDGGLAFQPAISADGKFVVYASDRAGDGDLDIWLQQTEGGDPIQLTSGPGDDAEPSFSPDGSQIVYRSGADGGIYLVSSLGGEPRQLAAVGQRPRFSPDGGRVAYWVGKEHVPNGSVYVVAVDGGEPTVVGEGRSPVWSPDGERLLYLSAAGGDYHWTLVDLRNGNRRATGAVKAIVQRGLSHDPRIMGRHSFVPDRWLPDGAVLFSATGGQALNIWSVFVSPRTGRASGSPQRITTGSGHHRAAGAAKDYRLAFADVRENRDIWLLPLDTNRGEPTGEPLRATSNPGLDEAPSLSNDGVILAFRSDRSGAIDVWAKDLLTGETRQLTDTDRSEGSIVVKPDGELVTFRVRETRRR